MSSQGKEDKYILEYFGNEGTFLDIGAYHPEVFSNVRGLFDRGWTGILIEPSPSCFPALKEFYKGTGVEIYNCGINTYTGTMDLWDSNGDALSTTLDSHKDKWEKNYGSTFTKIQVDCFTIEDLFSKSQFKSFDFVSIDVENDQLGFDILRQIDLTDVRMVCIEIEERHLVKRYLDEFREIYSNAENILLAR